MKTNNWESVFAVYADASEIYVCDGQPFLTEKEAGKHKQATGKDVEKVERSEAEKPEAPAKKVAAKKAPAKKKNTAKAKPTKAEPKPVVETPADEATGEVATDAKPEEEEDASIN